MKKQSPLETWQIIVTIIGGLALMWVIAGLMFQSAHDLGMIQ